MGAPSVPPGRYFRMHLVGYFSVGAPDRDRVPIRWCPMKSTRRRFNWVLVLIARRG